MPFDYQAHWQALYDAMRIGLDTDGHTTVPLLHVDASQDVQGQNEATEPPYVVYTEETMRNLGTTGSGPLKVMSDTWRITARDRDLGPVLDYISAIVNELEQEEDAVAVTSDGYTTTAIEYLGFQSFYETDSKLHAGHLRIRWERSA